MAICAGFALLRVTNDWAANLLMFVPGLVAVALRAWRREGFRSVGFRLGTPMAWVWAIVLPVAALVAWLSISWVLGWVSAAPAGSQGAALAADPMRLLRNLVIYLAISLPLSFGEELGWRGYLQERAVGELGAFKGLLLVGLVWGFWHSPIYYVMGTYPDHPVLGPFVMAPIDNVLAVVSMAWLYKVSGSIWVPTFTHAFADVLWGFSGIVFPAAAEIPHWATLQGVQLLISILLWRSLRRRFATPPANVDHDTLLAMGR
jgi:membrane protease YdiL (CAAX protease family)